MSRKPKSAATKEDAKPALVPKLRFPEFRGAEGWQITRLGDLCEVITKGATPTSYGFSYVDTGVRFVKIESLVDGRVEPSRTSFITDECNEAFARSQLKEDDILFSIAGALGVSALVEGHLLPANINQALALMRLKRGQAHSFLLHQLRSGSIQIEIDRIKARAAQPNVSLTQLGNFSALLPTAAEQQKIAQSLSSVDEAIAAQARKLDTLMAHKKGLMQQLFPREGETQPRLRFPEFQNAGKWEERKLGKHVEIQSGYSPSGYTLSSSGEYPFVKVEDLNNCIKYQMSGREFSDDSDGAVPANSLLFPKRGAAIELNKIRIAATEILIDTNLMALTPKDGLKVEFLYYYLSNVGLSHIADTSTIPQINNKHITPFDIRLPKEAEQLSVADCLSSLDALIAAETQMHAALQRHKRGLMQQLFPSSEEE